MVFQGTEVRWREPFVMIINPTFHKVYKIMIEKMLSAKLKNFIKLTNWSQFLTFRNTFFKINVSNYSMTLVHVQFSNDSIKEYYFSSILHQHRYFLLYMITCNWTGRSDVLCIEDFNINISKMAVECWYIRNLTNIYHLSKFTLYWPIKVHETCFNETRYEFWELGILHPCLASSTFHYIFCLLSLRF